MPGRQSSGGNASEDADASKAIGRPFGSRESDFDHLRIDDQGTLYWRGKRVRIEGWSRGEKIALFGALIPGLLALAAVGAAISKEGWSRYVCQTAGLFCASHVPGPAPQAPTSPLERSGN